MPKKDANSKVDSSSTDPNNDANAESSSDSESNANDEPSTFETVSDMLDAVENEAGDSDADDEGENSSQQDEDDTSDEDDSDEDEDDNSDEDEDSDDEEEDDDEESDSDDDSDEEDEDEDEDDDSDDDDDSAEDTDDEDEDVELDEKSKEYHKDPRFKKLIDQKNELKQQLEAQAPVMQSVNAIGQENMKSFTEFLIARESDPETALKMIQPMVAELMEANGYILSKDLKEKVEAGEIDEATAKELARKEAKIKALEKKNQLEQEKAKTKDTDVEDKQRAEFANNWEKGKAKSDPDYKRKKPFLMNTMLAKLSREGKPDIKDLPKFLDEVWDEVGKNLKGFAPEKKRKKKVKKKGQIKSKGKEKKVYKSTKDIVNDML